MVKLIHKERIAEGSTRRFLDGRRNDAPLRKGMVAKFRESHHIIAKLFAAGLKGNEIAARTGYAPNWLAQLHNDPAFQELLSKYRDLDTQLFLEGRDEFYSIATKNMLQAERQISDKMDEADSEGEILPTRELISIVADRADRFGYGKRETKFNVNVDFADALQRAIKRSGKAIDGTLNEGLGGMKTISTPPLLASSTANTTVPQSGVEPEGMPGDLPSSHRPLGRAQPPLTSMPSSPGSAEGAHTLGRSGEVPQNGLVHPGAAEPRPFRRRLLG